MKSRAFNQDEDDDWEKEKKFPHTRFPSPK